MAAPRLQLVHAAADIVSPKRIELERASVARWEAERRLSALHAALVATMNAAAALAPSDFRVRHQLEPLHAESRRTADNIREAMRVAAREVDAADRQIDALKGA